MQTSSLPDIEEIIRSGDSRAVVRKSSTAFHVAMQNAHRQPMRVVIGTAIKPPFHLSQ
jgi:hypothetical protein